MRILKAFIFLQLFISFIQAAAPGIDYSAYPVPPKNKNTLFYIQRSKNVNAIVYEANTRNDGTLDEDTPVKIFWMRYTTDSTQAPLTFIQDKYAYGVKTEAVEGKPNQYVIKLVSYDKRWIYLKPTPAGHYAAYMFINNTYAQLDRIFIQISGGTFWFPSIDYIELVGKDVKTQQEISEKFAPK